MPEQQRPEEGFAWDQMVQDVAEADEARSRLPKPGAKLTKAGQTLLGIFVACLLIGDRVVSLFFPERRGEGLDATTLAILIPIWVIG